LQALVQKAGTRPSALLISGPASPARRYSYPALPSWPGLSRPSTSGRRPRIALGLSGDET